jgi:hypothetical protein
MESIWTLTICSSSKFYDAAESLAIELSRITGVSVLTPRFDHDERTVTVDHDVKQRLTSEFLEKVRQASAVYVIASGGYTGRSVCIEVGFAYALGIPIFMSDAPTEPAVAALVTAVVPTEQVVAYFTNRGPVIEHR